MSAIRAIFEKGIFRPLVPVDLPDKSQVIFEPRVVNTEAAPTPAMGRVYEVLSRSYETNVDNLAERHDEHQP